MNKDNENRIFMYGADWCPDCRRAKDFLDSHGIGYVYNDIEIDKEGVKRVEAINKGKRIIPTFEILGKSYTNPDNTKLSCVLGINPQGRIILYGADWCPDCKRAKAFLDGHGLHYQFIDVDKYRWATQKVERINNGKRIIPTILVDGAPHTNPDNARLTELLNLEDVAERQIYDAVVVGAGAAGLTTALYCQRDKLSSIILEKKNIGGNAFLTENIENYPGFTSISGPDLMNKMAEQVSIYGAEIRQGVEVKHIKRHEDFLILTTNMGEFTGKAVVLCVGSTYRQLHLPGEKELIGAGIHFCATCDGPFYRDKDVIIIGGGNSALEEGIFLSQSCKSVKIAHRGKTFKATPTYIEKLETIDNIQTYMNTSPLEFLADENGLFHALRVKDNETGKEEEIQADGVFIFIGLVPNTGFLKGIVELDERGFIKTAPGSVQTSAPGIFAAGDCRNGAIAQIAAATGEGVIASFGVKEYLKN
jgi:thioredoxin reductase (NADPH)